jgi:hypothetical protein
MYFPKPPEYYTDFTGEDYALPPPDLERIQKRNPFFVVFGEIRKVITSNACVISP